MFCINLFVILGPLDWYFKPVATNLGVKTDSELKMDKQINSVVRSSFFQLTQLSKVKPFLSFGDFERVMCAFVYPPQLL